MATTGPKGSAPTQTERVEAQDSNVSALLGSAASMEKVRDILFGAQLREFEKRLTRVDEKVAKDHTEFREDARRRFDALELYVRSEIEALAAGLKSERGDREAGVRTSEKALLEALRAAERKIAQLDEQLAKVQRDLRQQQHEQHHGLRDELRVVREQLEGSLNSQVDDLRKDKVDRGAMAGLLTEVALRLTGELPVPDRR